MPTENAYPFAPPTLQRKLCTFDHE